MNFMYFDTVPKEYTDLAKFIITKNGKWFTYDELENTAKELFYKDKIAFHRYFWGKVYLRKMYPAIAKVDDDENGYMFTEEFLRWYSET